MIKTEINEKTILITGATSGIGEALTRQFAKQGTTIVAVGRNKEKLLALQAEFPNNIYYYAYDLMDLDNIEEIFLFCKENNLKLDGMIHSAGIVYNTVVKANNIKEMEETMRVNCFSFFELGKYFSMKKYSNDGSAIVAISSISALNSAKGLSQYAASKAALNSVVKTMSKEFLRRRIRVNAILPANVRTPMFMANSPQIENYEEKAEDWQPLGIIDPEQVGYMAEFLLSDCARYMTGELVVISGGMGY